MLINTLLGLAVFSAQAPLVLGLTFGIPNKNLISRADNSCTTPSGAGFCGSTADGCPGGTFTPGYCPGAANIQCCVSPCQTPNGAGNCQFTNNSCSGVYTPGYCTGPTTFQCCVQGNATTGAGVAGIDISTAPPSSFWSCAATTYKVVAIRGYQQACGIGGRVDPNFLPTYKAAKAAGISRVDGYLFPCTGTQPTGVACKEPATQLNEFLAVIKNNNMNLGKLWFDIEPTSSAAGNPCNAWQLSSSQNIALAKKWVALLQASGYQWGVYANGNQWSGMFGTRSADIGSQLPLWAVQADGKPGVNTVTTFMGGWTKAVAKQYKIDTTGCGWNGVDLDSFTP